MHVTGGDRRALRLLIGNSNDQTFAFGDTTIFLLWQGKVPTVIDASKLVVGDKIVVRIRAAKGASLGTGRVDAREPHRRPRARREVAGLVPGTALAVPGTAFAPFFYRGLTLIDTKGTKI